jgi:hypothetical protein
MASNKARCGAINCRGWDANIGGGWCTKHSKQERDSEGAMLRFFTSAPLRKNMLVLQPIVSPHYLKVKEGDIVDVLEILSDGKSVVCRTEAGDIGNFNLDFLRSHEEVWGRD